MCYIKCTKQRCCTESEKGMQKIQNIMKTERIDSIIKNRTLIHYIDPFLVYDEIGCTVGISGYGGIAVIPCIKSKYGDQRQPFWNVMNKMGKYGSDQSGYILLRTL